MYNAKMTGWYRWRGPYCECCNYPRSNKLIRTRERREWSREVPARTVIRVS